MSDQTITSLIEKLEGAEVGSRELDVSLAWNSWVEPKLWASTTSKGVTVWKVERQGKRVPLPNYTTSLDAALALAERLGLDGWKTLYAAMMSWKAHDPRGPLSTSLPLALCAAVLRAQSEARV